MNQFWEIWHLYHVDSSDPWTWNIFLEPHYWNIHVFTVTLTTCEALGGRCHVWVLQNLEGQALAFGNFYYLFQLNIFDKLILFWITS